VALSRVVNQRGQSMKPDLPDNGVGLTLRATTLRESAVPVADEQERLGVDRMAAKADEMERICRKLITGAKVAYVRDKSDIEDRYRDELAKLAAHHLRRMEDLEHSLRRIEALRSA
jgi:hypothetical protein